MGNSHTNAIGVHGHGKNCDWADKLYIKENEPPPWLNNFGITNDQYSSFVNDFNLDMQRSCPSARVNLLMVVSAVALGIVLGISVTSVLTFVFFILAGLQNIYFAVRTGRAGRLIVSRVRPTHNQNLQQQQQILPCLFCCLLPVSVML